MTKRERLEQQWNRIMHIKNILYGFGIPPKDSQIFKDIEDIQRKYTQVIKQTNANN